MRARSVVLHEIPDNCTVVGVPGRVVRRNNIKIPRNDMDQVDLPDPVLDDIEKLYKDNEILTKKIEELEKRIGG